MPSPGVPSALQRIVAVVAAMIGVCAAERVKGYETGFVLPSLGARLAPGNLQITFLSSRTFVVTDPITLRATVQGVAPGTPVFWTVTGTGAAGQISGFPVNEQHPAVGGVSTFVFTPSQIDNLVRNRHSQWTQGRCAPNGAIGFEVTARATIGGQAQVATLTQSGLGPLLQDPIDRLREEYFDYDGVFRDRFGQPIHLSIPVRTPTFSEVVPTVPGYNNGNYAYQLNADLAGHYTQILAAYRGRSLLADVTYGGQVHHNVSITIPANAQVFQTSAFRCPQHNRADRPCGAGSFFPNSKHVLGRALDLVPSPTMRLPLGSGGSMILCQVSTRSLYPVLQAAAESQSETHNAGCEKPGSSVYVNCTDPNVWHVHVQW